ncbi:hypothetical protein AB1Y20_002739 [Prymnesium parvum]|uniref:Uncharacterized protein n=1 Tax=Prymnesium parvum TaxID=97485 RepID=A0AB34JB90_PRYPA
MGRKGCRERADGSDEEDIEKVSLKQGEDTHTVCSGKPSRKPSGRQSKHQLKGARLPMAVEDDSFGASMDEPASPQRYARALIAVGMLLLAVPVLITFVNEGTTSLKETAKSTKPKEGVAHSQPQNADASEGASQLVKELNARYALGKPSSNVREGGVLIHQARAT